jgi:phosphomannomutase
MLASSVSSKFLANMAAAEGFRFEETLTGFKWLGNRALQLQQEGFTVRCCL